MYVLKKGFCWCVLFQIYTHLKNVFELLSKAVVESKQKVYIPKLSKEEPEEKEESEKTKEEERGIELRLVLDCDEYQISIRLWGNRIGRMFIQFLSWFCGKSVELNIGQICQYYTLIGSSKHVLYFYT